MTANPFQDKQDDSENFNSSDLTSENKSNDTRLNDHNAAAELIRKKIESIYAADAPDAIDELNEISIETTPLTKHQEYVQQLRNSGQSLSEIQNNWHRYYLSLPDNEKHQVWEEFYAANGQATQPFNSMSRRIQSAQEKTAPGISPDSTVVIAEHALSPHKQTHRRGSRKTHRKIINQITSNGHLKAKHHLQSIGFGLGVGALVIIIFLFSFFNEVIIAPFIQPSRNAPSTPIILSTDQLTGITTPEIIIPKINVQIPVDYTETSTDDSVIEGDLNSGVVHYPSTVLPGQLGNTAFFGHSSNNIFNPGKYKFAFVLLHTLVPGDTFYLIYQSKAYVYQVYARQIVPPNDVSVLNNVTGKTATATLITCDPPGTSINRLVVWGEQISPDPTSNTTAPIQTASTSPAPTVLPGNGPTLWGRFIHWLF